MMNNKEKIVLQKTSNSAVDAIIFNVLKILPIRNSSDDVQRVCDAVKKLMPYADADYISYQVNKISASTCENIKTLNCSEVIEDYAHSLLQDNNKGVSKSGYNPRCDSYHRKNNADFKMDSLGSVLNKLQKKECYKEDSSPNMVIHVCDEAKNLKQDFNCPRDLLIKEMRYFAEYLSVDSQRLEEVDISVHCDIHIFDWLMRYVKRGTKLIDENEVPKLDPNNVISILISSDFLKMESLVEACIAYCHKNMSLIVAAPCNMNCVNEKLTSLIAEKFNHNELEDVKDRKDKFKSKLFCKKIEKLFDPNASNLDSPGKGSLLFKCLVCQRILTTEFESKIPCINNRLSVSNRGGLSYLHEPDTSWDVNTYLISLFEELHKWNLVYWRLWGLVNHLQCSRCSATFQLCDFGCCMHHPDRPHYRLLSGGDMAENPVGIYPCCNQQVLRFDPTGLNKGCRAKDHVVAALNKKQQRVLDDFVSHKALVKSPSTTNCCSGDLNIFASEELRCNIKEATMTPIEILSAVASIPSAAVNEKRTKLKKGNFFLENDDEDIAGEEDVSTLKKTPTQSSLNLSLSPANNSTLHGGDTARSQASNKKKEKVQVPADRTSYRKFPCKQRWDSTRSIRFNQDIQREEDRRRMATMTSNLAKQRSNEKVDKSKTKDPKELPGGIFMKLEMAFLNNLKGQSGPQIQSLSRHYGGKDFKSKPRR